MRRKELIKIENDYKQAIGLLRHDLVWSNDFESIRLDLADYLEAMTDLVQFNHPALSAIVQKLIATDNDFSI